MKARFIGNPANDFDGARTITVFGVEFVKGEWADVPADAYARLATNNHFEVADPLDHDANGKKGGKGKAKAEPKEPEAPAFDPAAFESED